MGQGHPGSWDQGRSIRRRRLQIPEACRNDPRQRAFPYSRSASPQEESMFGDSPATSGTHRCSVLIVEDDALLASAIGLCVEEAGYEVAGTARSVDTALSMLAYEKVDAALLDRLQPALELRAELLVHGEAIRDAQELVVEGAQSIGGDGRHDVAAG